MSTTKERPSFTTIYLNLAKGLAERSTCSRLQVGSVITTADHRHVLAVGYNGGASGLNDEHSCKSDVPGQCGHLHSEINAIINCTAPRHVEKILYVTHTPCIMCAKAIINLGGVIKVVVVEPYRSEEGSILLRRAGIPVSFHKPS